MATAKRLLRLVRQDRLDEARVLLDTAGPELAREPQALRARAMLAEKEGRPGEAVVHYHALLALEPGEQSAGLLGLALLGAERFAEARDHYREWVDRLPDSAAMWSGLGDSLAALGERQAAVEALRRATELDPEGGGAWYMLTTLGDYQWLHGQRGRLLAPCAPGRDVVDRYNREFAVARYLEKQGEWDSAFAHLQSANDLRRTQDQMHIRRKIDAAHLVMDDWDRQDLSDASALHADMMPVFIVGMPRSGTSLVEQILDSHPDVTAIGERHFLKEVVGDTLRSSRAPIAELDWRAAGARYLERVRSLTGEVPCFTDKMMFNFNMVGFIRLMFDNARIVHCRRDPMDTCISCFRTSFNQSRLSYTLEELGSFYGFYESFMDFWQGRFGEIFVDMQYETLVNDPPGQVARLLEALGLPWSDRCLDYHANRRIVATASMQQVRRKPYRTSIGRAAPYERHLGPLRKGIEAARERMRREPR